MSSSKAARFSRTELGVSDKTSSPASLQVATLVDLPNEQEARLTMGGKTVTAAILQSARADIAGMGLQPPFAVLVGRLSGAASHYVVISPAVTEPSAAESPSETLVLSAESAIELRCGASQITLTKDGKITIKGVDVHSRAARACKIKGGTVNIN